jgi:radical SAM protein with 4Fe4S-binding SPASM domain
MFKVIEVAINNDCICRCIMCDRYKYSKARISLDTFKRNIYQYYPNATYILNGGEPLLHPEIKEYLSLLKDNHVWMYTSGLTKSDFDINILENVKSIRISLDAGTQKSYEKIRGVNKFDSVLKFAKNIKDIIRDTAFSVTLQKDNYDTENILNLINIADKLNVGIRFYPVRGVDYSLNLDAIDWQKVFFNLPRKTTNIFKCMDEIHNGIPTNFRKCYATKHYCYIESDGNVVPCCMMGGPKYQASSSDFCYGNIFDSDLNKIEGSLKFFDIQQKLTSKIVPCNECNVLYHFNNNCEQTLYHTEV